MLCNEAWIWKVFLGHNDLLSLGLEEGAFELGVGEVVSQAWTEEDPEFVVEGDQSAIKCGIECCGEAKPVARVGAVGLILRPWDDVAGTEKFRNRIASDAAAVTVGAKNGLAEK